MCVTLMINLNRSLFFDIFDMTFAVTELKLRKNALLLTFNELYWMSDIKFLMVPFEEEKSKNDSVYVCI